jgi:glycosyltransferase involved in cell wall biosynthesis
MPIEFRSTTPREGMRIALFDWVGGGHHPIYLRRFADALDAEAEVVVAAPDETLRQFDDDSTRAISLGDPRPHIAPGRAFDADGRRILRKEIQLLERVVDESDPDHLVHLYADSILPYLVRRPRFRPSVSVLVFYPRSHYPEAYQTPLRLGERARAAAKDLLIATWRRRRDSYALMTLDEEAARRWRGRRGAAAHWIPEPPVPVLGGAPYDAARAGCIVYGSLAARKGIDLLAAAMAAAPVSVAVTIAGEPKAPFLPRLEELVEKMRRAGATVDVRAYRHSETEGLRVLARAKCAVLPYPLHDGMSRVLVEACSVGTPVVVHDRGLLGYLVRRYGLGHAVDCHDAGALRRAVLELVGADNADYADNLGRFASRFSAEAFENSLTPIFLAGNGAPPPRAPAAAVGDSGRR